MSFVFGFEVFCDSAERFFFNLMKLSECQNDLPLPIIPSES